MSAFNEAKEPLNPSASRKPERSISDQKLQYIAVLAVGLLAISGDVGATWTSPVYPKLYSNDTAINPLGRPITEEEDSWIGSLLNIGAITGSIPAGLLADKFGRKCALLGLAVPHFLAYLIFSFANEVYLFYIGRIMTGLGIGAGYALLPMYITEITEDSNRNTLSSTLVVFWTFGNFIPYAIGPYMSIKVFNYILTCIPLTFFIIFLLFGSESPYYLVNNGENEKAEKVLMKLRSCDKDVAKKEILKIQETLSGHENGGFADIFTSKVLRKALILSLLLIILQQLAGINAILYYLQPIFEASRTSISADISSTIFGASIFLFSFTSSYVVSKAGKKIPLAISCIGLCFSLTVLGIYFYINDSTSLSTSNIFWLPIFGLISYIFFFDFGFAIVPWTISSELFPNSVKAISASAVSFCSFSFSFLVTRFFNLLNDKVGRAGTFWFFGGCCLISLIVDIVWVPETKGKSLSEIQNVKYKEVSKT